MTDTLDPRIIIGARYADLRADDEFVIESWDRGDDSVDLDNGQWYEIHGPEGLVAKLDAGIVTLVERQAS